MVLSRVTFHSRKISMALALATKIDIIMSAIRLLWWTVEAIVMGKAQRLLSYSTR
jgi:uncharacterized membrane-anchored protein